MKKLFLISYFLFLISYLSYGQVNLVFNPSFEAIDSCPNAPGQITYAIDWKTLVTGGGDPDLHSLCAPSICYCSSPVAAGNGFQYPNTGNVFGGLMTLYGTNLREYIQGKLSNTLNTSTSYCVTFYVNLRNNAKYYCNSIGAYLDNGQVYASTTFGIAQGGTPQINNTSVFLTDTLNWIKIEGSFIADGTENYITIGNFLDDTSSDSGIFSNTNITAYAYYNIDDVSVIDISTPAYAGVDTTITIGDSVFIGRTPEIGLDDDCVWYANGSPIDTVAGLWVMPDSTTTYILEQTICGYTTYDTVTVTVLPTSINELFKENDVRLYPNPNKGTFTITHNFSGENYNLEITDLMGKVVHRQLLETKNNVVQINTNQLSNGIYFVTISSTYASEKIVKKLVIQK